MLIFLSAQSQSKSVYPKKLVSNTTKTDPLGVLSAFENLSKPNTLPDTIRICALRAEFVKDDVATTTGNGKFDLSTTSEYIFNPPPHNKTYFEQQLSALSNYFNRVSQRRLNFSFDVFPSGENDNYQLPNDMVYYSGQENEELQKQRWTEMLRDAVDLADNNDGPVFSNYDVFIVFHAGVGEDFAFDFDPSPYDIQSVFLDFESIKETLGEEKNDYLGIPTKEKFYIQEGIILPETQNQEGINLGLLGTMTLLMGSQLGMPNLYDTETGLAGIGRWGLMDQGSFNVQGLVPAEPCAWTKIFMGWEEPVEITQGQNLKVGIQQAASAPHIYKIPITTEEYFLIENRQKDWNNDGVTFGRDIDGKRVQIDTLGQITADDGVGVLLSVDEYDFGVPGSGILIWHIDERVVRQNLPSNTINNNPDWRGVDLIECDGAQDIGYQYGLFQAGSGTESGDYWDAYWSGNISHKIVNQDAEFVELSSSTIPNSNSNDNAKSFIRIYNIGARDSTMTFSVSSDLAMAGFPQYAGDNFSISSLLDININENKAVVAVSKDGQVLGWRTNGNKVIENYNTVEIASLYGPAKHYDYAQMVDLEKNISLSPLAFDTNGDGADEIIVLSDDGQTSVIETKDKDANGFADIISTLDLNVKPSAGLFGFAGKIVFGDDLGTLHVINPKTGPVPDHLEYSISSSKIVGLSLANNTQVAAVNSQIVVVSESGQVSLLNNLFEKLWDINLSTPANRYYPCSADFDGDGKATIAIIATNGFMTHLDLDGNIVSQTSLNAELSSMSAPALGDMDADGLPEILINTENGFYVFESNGTNSTNFPVLYNSVPNTTPPVWYGNKDKMLTLANSENLIYAYDEKSKTASGFPIAAAANFSSSPLLTDLDNNGTLDLFVISNDQFLYGWDLELADNKPGGWLQFGGDALRSFSYIWTSQDIVLNGGFMPAKKVFCYPNPTENDNTNIRYSLNSNADMVSIKIYDIAGDFVQDLFANGNSVGDHEVIWNVASIESGVYLARVQADFGGTQNVNFIKIAVVK